MNTNSDTPPLLYLGLDAHKEQTVIAPLEPERNAEPEHYGSVATSQHALERAVRRIAKARMIKLADIHMCYEASGCEFWIARLFLRLNARSEVIAPSLIPTTAGDRFKTERRERLRSANPADGKPSSLDWC